MDSKDYGLAVLDACALKGWKIEYSNAGALCLFESKTIFIEPASTNHPGQVLHEIAHAWAITETGEAALGTEGHGFEWWKRFEQLVSKFTKFSIPAKKRR